MCITHKINFKLVFLTTDSVAQSHPHYVGIKLCSKLDGHIINSTSIHLLKKRLKRNLMGNVYSAIGRHIIF